MPSPDQLFPVQQASRTFADRVVMAAVCEQRRSLRRYLVAQITGAALLPLAVLVVGAQGVHTRAERVEQLDSLVNERKARNDELRTELDARIVDADAMQWLLAHPTEVVTTASTKGTGR